MSPRKPWTPEVLGWLVAGTVATGIAMLSIFLNQVTGRQYDTQLTLVRMEARTDQLHGEAEVLAKQPLDDVARILLAADMDELRRALDPLSVQTGTDQAWLEATRTFLDRVAELPRAQDPPQWYQVEVLPAYRKLDTLQQMATARADRSVAETRLLNLLVFLGVLGAAVFGGVALYFRVQRRYAARLLKETEQRAMAHQERYYRTLMGQAADIFLVTDAANIIREVSPTVTAVMGYRPQALIGIDGIELMHPDDLPAATVRRQAVRQDPREAAVRVHRFRHADGSWRHMEVTSLNLLADEQVAGCLHTLRDITERVQTEAALREREERLRLMMEHSSDIITLYDTTGKNLYTSPATQAKLGISPEEYAAAAAEELVHPDDLAAVRTARHGAETGWQASVTFRMRNRQGEYRWFETLSSPIFDDAGHLVRIQAATRDVTERKQVEDELTYVAYHDALTKLPNRAACLLDLDALLRTGGHDAALLFLDLDNFKLINDSLGHEAGDHLLQEVAARLQAFVGRTGMAARLAGDEFVVLLQGVKTVDDVTRAVRDLLDQIGRPARLGGHQVYPACSVGIVQVEARHRTPDDLLRDADLALHVTKSQGKGSYQIFDPAMLTEAMRRLHLETDLREAAGTDQMSLVYQPITALDSGQVYSLEALLRWNHPELGPVSPAEFIPVAEETGLIIPIGRWVLEQACREASTWTARFGRPITLSVNLSAVQVRQADLAHQVAAILAETGLPASQLKLELTETALMNHADSAPLQELRALGVRLAIDDFGTGFSSLNYLRRFPVDVLKIDRSFVSGLGRRPEETALVRTVIGLASSLGLRVTAEGVETAAQARMLRELGCTSAQGYYFARPTAPADLDALIGNWQVK